MIKKVVVSFIDTYVEREESIINEVVKMQAEGLYRVV
jgi:hypothetical protein